MVRRSFRIGLRLGLLVGIALALVKTVQARRSRETVSTEPWTPLDDAGATRSDWLPVTPTAAAPPAAASPGAAPRPPVAPPPAAARPVDEVGEPITEPPPAEAARPVDTPVEAGEAPMAAEGAGAEVPEAGGGPGVGEAPARMSAVEPLPLRPLPSEPMPVEPIVPAARAPKKAAPASKSAARRSAPKPRWVEPEEGVCPPTHPIKARLASMIYHLPGMAAYNRTRPDRCYANERGASRDGFVKAKR